jgi:uncharacterized protein (DUF2062 family)
MSRRSRATAISAASPEGGTLVFKRRNRRTLLEWLREFVYPKGGFRRAAYYVSHRLRRLPDEPHRIARGVFAGVFVSFTPLFGFHFLSAAGLAWLMRGNILAALLATFVGNPITTPFIAVSAVETGHWLLGSSVDMSFLSIVTAFSNAGTELWENFLAVFTDAPTQWSSLKAFFHTYYWPYMIGGILPGLAVSLLFYWATIPLVRTYQKLRSARLRERVEKRRGTAAFPGDDAGPGAP